MRRAVAGAGIVAGILYLGFIIVLLVGQARAPFDAPRVDAARQQLRSAALESAQACQSLTEGRATAAYVTSSGMQLADQTRSVVQSLEGARFTPDAAEQGRRVTDSGRRLADLLTTAEQPSGLRQPSRLREQLLGIAQELSR